MKSDIPKALHWCTEMAKEESAKVFPEITGFETVLIAYSLGIRFWGPGFELQICWDVHQIPYVRALSTHSLKNTVFSDQSVLPPRYDHAKKKHVYSKTHREDVRRLLATLFGSAKAFLDDQAIDAHKNG